MGQQQADQDLIDKLLTESVVEATREVLEMNREHVLKLSRAKMQEKMQALAELPGFEA